jgi:hypothetical protein
MWMNLELVDWSAQLSYEFDMLPAMDAGYYSRLQITVD